MEFDSGIFNNTLFNSTKQVNGPNPIWNFTKSIPVTSLQQRISFRIKSVNVFAPDNFVGGRDFNLNTISNGKTEDIWLKLVSEKRVLTGGLLHIAITFKEETRTSQKEQYHFHEQL
jgi:Ca2+-dependent lipid-binding protein